MWGRRAVTKRVIRKSFIEQRAFELSIKSSLGTQQVKKGTQNTLRLQAWEEKCRMSSGERINSYLLDQRVHKEQKPQGVSRLETQKCHVEEFEFYSDLWNH